MGAKYGSIVEKLALIGLNGILINMKKIRVHLLMDTTQWIKKTKNYVGYKSIIYNKNTFL